MTGGLINKLSSQLSFSLRIHLILALIAVFHRYPVQPISTECDSGSGCTCDIGKTQWTMECLHKALKLTGNRLNKSDEGLLEVKCKFRQMPPSWMDINDVEFYSEQIQVNIVKLKIDNCPVPDDGWEYLLGKLNVVGETIQEFEYIHDGAGFQNNTLPPNCFDSMPNLEVLSLKTGKLSVLPSTSGLTKLRKVDFKFFELQDEENILIDNRFGVSGWSITGTVITEIKGFGDNLECLALQGNHFRKLSPATFTSLRKLRFLELHNNSYDEMNLGTFDGLLTLENFTLYTSRMPHYPNFQNLPNLVHLQISDTDIPDGENKEESRRFFNVDNIGGKLTLKHLPSLETLTLRKNAFKEIPKLEDLPKLYKIDLRGNHLTYIRATDFNGLSSLRIINLRSNRIETFEAISIPTLVELDVSNNSLIKLNKNMFTNLPSLKKLSLASNKIHSIHTRTFEALENLEEVDLQRNLLTSPNANPPLSNSIVNDSPWDRLIGLKRLNLAHNEIDNLEFSGWKKVLSVINWIDLSYNKIRIISANDLDYFSSRNLTLNLENNNISSVDMSQSLSGLEDDENLNTGDNIRVMLNHNPLSCDCIAYGLKTFTSKCHKFHMDKLACASPPELQSMFLHQVPDNRFTCGLKSETDCPESCECKERPADNIVSVNCSGQNRTDEDIPKLDSLIKSHPNSKIELDLSGNAIRCSKIPANICKYLDKIAHLDFSRNNLTSLTFLHELGTNETKFSVTGNPFLCSNCEFLINWQKHLKQIRDSDKLTCSRSGDKEEKVNVEYGLLGEFCLPVSPPSLLLYLVIAALMFMSLLSVGFFMSNKYGWAVKAYLYSKGVDLCMSDSSLEDEDSQKKMYDAFISYSSKDEEWVLNELVDKLEEMERFRLCLHFRDWTPGDWIPDQIVRSVDSSRRTVVILSKNFVESIWSRLEFKAAHAQALKERSNRVILILLGDDLKENDVQDNDLKMYMKMNTFMRWNDPLFWHKLMYALPHRRSSFQAANGQHLMDTLRQRKLAGKLDKLRVQLEGNHYV